jgi:microcystin-dependent protein
MTILTTPKLSLPYPDPDATADIPRDIEALAAKLDDLVYIVGELRAFALAAPPPKWVASGQVLSQAGYPELYAAVADLWNVGGEAAGQFRGGPVVAGRSLVGAGQGAGLTNRPVASRWGAEAVTLTSRQSGTNENGQAAAANPAHSHAFPGSIPGYVSLWGIGNDGAKAPAYIGTGLFAGTNAADISHGHALTGRNADDPHENAGPSIAALICIYAGR